MLIQRDFCIGKLFLSSVGLCKPLENVNIACNSSRILCYQTQYSILVLTTNICKMHIRSLAGETCQNMVKILWKQMQTIPEKIAMILQISSWLLKWIMINDLTNKLSKLKDSLTILY